MSSSEVKTYVIPDDLCRRAGLCGQFFAGDTLSIHAFRHVHPGTKDVPSDYAPAESNIHQLRPQSVIFDPIVRKLVNESHGIFLAIQRIANEQSDNEKETRNELLKYSRQYRSIIRACLENLQEEVESNKIEEDKEKYSSYITIFYSIECIWHLSEILFVDQVPGNAVLEQLLEWIWFHFPKHERNAANLLCGSLLSGAEILPQYWETLIGVFMQGRIDVARTLLKLHSGYESTPFKVVDEALKTMPIYNVLAGITLSDFQIRQKQWQIETQIKIDSKAFASQRQLELIMKLAVGDVDTWECEAMSRCESWYEFLACRLFYTEPYVQRHNLGMLAQRCLSSWPQRMKHLDRILLTLMQQDVPQFIEEIQQMSDNGWFAAHLIDILYFCNALSDLDSYKNSVSRPLHDSLIIEYGSMLMSHHSLWQVGVKYLSHCGNGGMYRLKHLLERVPLGSEGRTSKILQVAHAFGFVDIYSSICKQRAVISLHQKRPGNALAWALRSRDATLSSYLADSFLRNYTVERTMMSVDVLDTLGGGMLISDRLVFLGKYYEFYKAIKSRKLQEAGALLISLISSKITPDYFWGTLFKDAIPLLECEEIILSSNDTYELLHCVNQHSDDKDLEEQIQVIQIAIARNIARSLVNEIQSVAL